MLYCAFISLHLIMREGTGLVGRCFLWRNPQLGFVAAETNIIRSEAAAYAGARLSVRVMRGEIIAGQAMSLMRSVEIGHVTLHGLILCSRSSICSGSAARPRAVEPGCFLQLSLRLILTKFDNFLTSTYKPVINEGCAEQRGERLELQHALLTLAGEIKERRGLLILTFLLDSKYAKQQSHFPLLLVISLS